ncbi:MAG: orotidine 5'-phosphate decarboxylase / HUMPS family protein [Candidatus Heimdallarchaeaceae archaeon]
MVLSTPPYLQIALDLVNFDTLEEILESIPNSEKIILEAGTPLIKKFGINIIKTIHNFHPQSYVVADMKTLDVGELEVQIAAEAKADAVAVSGLAAIETIIASISKAKEQEMDIILDLMNVAEPMNLLNELEILPTIVLFHRGIDQEGQMDHPWELIAEIKNVHPEMLIAVAGGLNIETAKKALKNSADIIVVGRAITASENVTQAVNEFLTLF